MSPEGELKELMLRTPRLTLAVAESLTCGQLQARIGAVPGASEYFLGGITTYNLEQKVRLLGVNRAHARRVNCVSQQVAVEMAQGACALFGAELALATTGYAQPNPAAGVSVPMAWWALVHRLRGGRARVIAEMVTVPGAGRVAVQGRVAALALRQLVAHLREWRGRPLGRASRP
jgi:nicotinamide-nucleotide amidase